MKLTNSISPKKFIDKQYLIMFWERIKNSLIEYPDVPGLGIHRSDKYNWVPADFMVVKLDQAIGAGVKGVGILKTGVENIVTGMQEFRSGSISLDGKTRGDIYHNSVIGD